MSVDIKDFTLGTAKIMRTSNAGTKTGNETPLSLIEDSAGGEILGLKTDAKNSATDATTVGYTGLFKQISFSIQAVAAALAGTLTVASHAVTNAGTFAVQVTSAPSTAVTNAGTFAVNPAAAAIGGATNLHFFSVASAPAAVAIKASAGTLYGAQAINTGAAPVYLKLYNLAAGSVVVGTTVPLVTIPVPTTATTGAGIAISFPVGISFGIAISYTFTNAAADNDATAVAVGTTLNVQFA